MNTQNKLRIFHQVRMYLFLVLLFGGMVIGAIIALRPKYSQMEKRKLQKVPEFSVNSLWEGRYFSELTTWYSDTFPFREVLLESNGKVERLYGLKKEQLTGSTVIADEIPSINTTDKDLTSNNKVDDIEVTEPPSASEDGQNENDVKEDVKQDDNTGTDNRYDSDSSQTTSDKVDSGSADEVVEHESQTSRPNEADINNSQAFGSIYVTKNRAFSLYYFSLEAANQYAKTISNIGKKLTGVANVYDILAPTSIGIYLDEEKSNKLGTSDQKAAFNYIYSKLNDSVKSVEVFDNIKSHRDEYIYFRTDHHWTALGAYYAYEKFCEVKGIEPNKLSSFEKKEYGDFLGSYYAAADQSLTVKKNIDTIEAYVPMGTNTMTFKDKSGVDIKWPIINDVSKYKSNSKYSTFVAGDNAYSYITNKNSMSKQTCVVVKESYGNAMIPFLVDHYKKVYIVDYRYYKGNLIELVKKKKINDVIFINNAEAINKRVVSLIDKIS